jgi:hypothetical protein
VAAARHAAERVKAGKLVAVAGGGDTDAALRAAGVAGDFTFVSTTGVAFLQWMEGKNLSGVAALDNQLEREGRRISPLLPKSPERMVTPDRSILAADESTGTG